jgi:hypothetical protein
MRSRLREIVRVCSHAQRENGFLAQLGPEAGGESAEPLLQDRDGIKSSSAASAVENPK